MKLHNYFFDLFYMELSHSHDSGHEFCRLVKLTRFFDYFLIEYLFFKKLYPSTLG